MMPSNEELKHMNGSKVETLPVPSHSKKFWWHIEASQYLAYDPQSLFEIYYFAHKRNTANV